MQPRGQTKGANLGSQLTTIHLLWERNPDPEVGLQRPQGSGFLYLSK